MHVDCELLAQRGGQILDDAVAVEGAALGVTVLKELRARATHAQTRARRGAARRLRGAAACPISTEGWTRRVHFVREGGGGGGGGARAGRGCDLEDAALERSRDLCAPALQLCEN